MFGSSPQVRIAYHARTFTGPCQMGIVPPRFVLHPGGLETPPRIARAQGRSSKLTRIAFEPIKDAGDRVPRRGAYPDLDAGLS